MIVFVEVNAQAQGIKFCHQALTALVAVSDATQQAAHPAVLGRADVEFGVTPQQIGDGLT